MKCSDLQYNKSVKATMKKLHLFFKKQVESSRNLSYQEM